MSSDLRFEGGGLSTPINLKPSSQARVMRLRVDTRTGAVVLTFPRRMSQRKALEWAAQQKLWIEAALAKVEPPIAIAPGAALPLYGLPHLVDWQPGPSRRVQVEPGRILAGGPLDGLERRLLRWLKGHALELLTAETQEFAGKADVSVAKVAVGDPLTRWGSCSSSGAIRYSWRLILAPDWVRRATVAHEVAHRIHMNHGPHFHALVQELLGEDPGPARQWLRREGASIHRVGRI